MAAGDLPPYVVSGQPIASAWGNAVVDELLRQRNEVDIPWQHNGGSTLYMGTSNIGRTDLSFAYPVRVTVWADFRLGYSGAGVGVNGQLYRLVDAVVHAGVPQYSHSGYYIMQTLSHAWDVAPGQNAGFITQCNWSAAETTGIGVYFSAAGVYRIQRTGAP